MRANDNEVCIQSVVDQVVEFSDQRGTFSFHIEADRGTIVPAKVAIQLLANKHIKLWGGPFGTWPNIKLVAPRAWSQSS